MSNYEKESKAVSYFLRHDEAIRRDEAGYVFVDDLLAAMRPKFPGFSLDALKQIVAEDEKQRYSFMVAHWSGGEAPVSIRANQGHSVDVDLGLKEAVPPPILFHGTDGESFEEIRKSGIKKMKRHAVHLSDDPQTAEAVGKRRGPLVVIAMVDTRDMVRDGVKFFLSENGVWLTDFVDTKYIVDHRRVVAR